MKNIIIRAYEFDELSDSAKEKARQWFREASVGDDFWSECVLEDAEEQAAYLGIEIRRRHWTTKRGSSVSEPCIYWSGFSSQGDGACFEGSWSASRVQADKVAAGWGDAPATRELKRIAKEFDGIAKEFPNAHFTVKHSGHYCHKYCTDFAVHLGDGQEEDGCEPPLSKEERSAAEEYLIEVARDFMEWIYRQLEQEYYSFISDESVDAHIRANEYLFTAEGKRSVVL